MKLGVGVRILVCSDAFYPPKGGGVLSLRAFCSGLADRGFGIATCYLGTQKDPAWSSHPQDFALFMRGMWPRIWELKRRWRKAILSLIKSESVDVVIAHPGVLVPTTEACEEMDVPVVVLVQGVDHFCLGSFWSGEPWKCEYNCVGCKDAGNRLWQFPFFLAQIDRTRDAFHKAKAVVTNSEFTQRTLKMLWGIDSFVIQPIPSESQRAWEASRGSKILFFSPLAHKGVSIAIELARSLESEKFMFVGDIRRRTRNQLRAIANIEYLPWTSDTNALYDQTKLLIMPSLIPEGFGRACVEAMRRGIPCIVSNIGALPETVGSGGDVVRRYRDAEEWAGVLMQYSDPSYWAKKSLDAVNESIRFQGLGDVDQMAAILDSLVGR